MKVYLFSEDEFTWMWTDQVTVPAWKFVSPNKDRLSRSKRIFSNALDAYYSTLAGRYDMSESIVVHAYGIDNIDLDGYKVNRVDHDESFLHRVSMVNQILTIYTPLFSLDAMDWYSNPYQPESHHLYVDASAIFNEDIGYTCYAMYTPGQDVIVEELDAASSVDAEYRALIRAIWRAHEMALESQQRIVVFADCTPAIVKALWTDMNPLQKDILGQTVFVQWVPGHRGLPGVEKVDRAARNHLRSKVLR